MKSRIAPAAVLILVALGTAFALTGTAQAAGGEAELTSATASARSQAALRGYTTRADLVTVARRHAARMAARGAIFHNPALGAEVTGWSAVGENVGTGPDAAAVHKAFMNSSSHRANILDRTFSEIGVGTAFDGSGVLFVVQVFRQPEAASAPAPAQPAAAPSATRPAAAPAQNTATAPAPRAATTRQVLARPVVARSSVTQERASLAVRLATLRAASRTTTGSAIERAVAFSAALDAVA